MLITGVPTTKGAPSPGPTLFGPYKDWGMRTVCVRADALIQESWVNPVAASTTSLISTGVAGPNTTTTTTLAGSAAADGVRGATGVADFARNLVLTVTHGSSIVAMTGIIYGYDIHGKPLTEPFTITATGTTKTFTGKKAFAQWTRVDLTSASDASTNTIKLGHGNVFGLYCENELPGAVKETEDGSIVTTGTFVAKSSVSTDDAYGTYAPATAPNGTHDYAIWYISADPGRLL